MPTLPDQQASPSAQQDGPPTSTFSASDAHSEVTPLEVRGALAEAFLVDDRLSLQDRHQAIIQRIKERAQGVQTMEPKTRQQMAALAGLVEDLDLGSENALGRIGIAERVLGIGSGTYRKTSIERGFGRMAERFMSTPSEERAVAILERLTQISKIALDFSEPTLATLADLYSKMQAVDPQHPEQLTEIEEALQAFPATIPTQPEKGTTRGALVDAFAPKDPTEGLQTRKDAVTAKLEANSMWADQLTTEARAVMHEIAVLAETIDTGDLGSEGLLSVLESALKIQPKVYRPREYAVRDGRPSRSGPSRGA